MHQAANNKNCTNNDQIQMSRNPILKTNNNKHLNANQANQNYYTITATDSKKRNNNSVKHLEDFSYVRLLTIDNNNNYNIAGR